MQIYHPNRFIQVYQNNSINFYLFLIVKLKKYKKLEQLHNFSNEFKKFAPISEQTPMYGKRYNSFVNSLKLIGEKTGKII